MAKLNEFIHWPSFASAMAVSGLGGFVAYKWMGLGFWVGFGLTAVAMFVNGWLATVEDEQPGGFHNPVVDKDKDEPDSRPR